jgi:predicted transcriptional regulator
MNQAWENMDNKKENKTKLTNTMLGYYKHLHESFDTTKTAIIPETIKHKVQSLAKLVARLQTKVEKDRNEGMIYRPVSAIATRLSLQFKNLITCLAFVRNETTVSESTYDIVRKVGFDSCPGLNFEIIDYIRKHKTSTRKSLVSNLKIPSTRVHQILTDLEQLGMITQDKEPNSVGGRGRDSYTYSLSEELLDCLEHTHDKTNNKVGKRSTTKPRSNNKRTPSKA